MQPDAPPLPEIDLATARALLEWQIELGADEPIGEEPQDRFAPPAPVRQSEPRATAPVAASAVVTAEPLDPVAEATALAAAAPDLVALAEAMAGFERCELKRGARNFVFADGNPMARVLILGEAPGREEDLEGRPFVGASGQMLNRMLAAIGMSRDAPDPAAAVYITNVLPWRPPANRDPTPAEIAMFRPFIARHIDLVAPEVVVLMGNPACQAALGKQGITRLRGHWVQAFGRPALPMTHPAHLLRHPEAKREAWADLLSLKSRLDG